MSFSSNVAQQYDRRRRREAGLVHLQYVGDMPGTPAGELEIGDRLMWNTGAVYVVTGIRELSPQYIQVTEAAESGPHKGTEYPRRLKRDRLVVRAKPGERWPRATR